MERYLKSTTNMAQWRSCALKHDGEELHSVRMAATQVAPVTAPSLGKLQILLTVRLLNPLLSQLGNHPLSRYHRTFTDSSGSSHGSGSGKTPDITNS